MVRCLLCIVIYFRKIDTLIQEFVDQLFVRASYLKTFNNFIKSSSPCWEGAGVSDIVSTSIITNISIGIDCSLPYKCNKQFLINAHTVNQRTKYLDIFLSIYLNTEQTIWQRINNNMGIIKLTCDGSWSIITGIFRINDVHNIITNMSLFMNLLVICWIGWHGSNFMKNNFHNTICIIRSRNSCSLFWIKTSKITTMCSNINRPTKSTNKFSIQIRFSIISENNFLVILSFLDINNTKFQHFPTRTFVKLL
mmetsp:Transcript_10705/g.16802  ORF Transcript_10705/g.16802 Transcript_10705/m.16802 type:complete len:251 (-) Transcript_10705:3580-4332(-)